MSIYNVYTMKYLPCEKEMSGIIRIILHIYLYKSNAPTPLKKKMNIKQLTVTCALCPASPTLPTLIAWTTVLAHFPSPLWCS